MSLKGLFNGAVTFFKGVGAKMWITIATTAAVATVGTAATVTLVKQGQQGIPGVDGADGADGKSAYELVVENGYTGTLDEWLASLVGEVGATGEDGKDGKSAYELAVENGYVGDAQSWLASLIGVDGKDGKSAYEIAVHNGYIGTEQEWLASLVGAKGDKGDTGEQGPKGEQGPAGATPYIGENGNWHINGIDIGYPSCGKDGESSYIAINEDGYWVINGEVTSYLAEGDNRAIIEALSSMFEYKQDQFICESETLPNPSWNYETSTFSGWGGSIGTPDFVDAIAIRVRARDVAITQIKFHLNYNDKTGESIVSEVVDVYIPPYEEAEIVWDVPVKLQDNQSSLYFCYNCNQLCDVYSNFGSVANISGDDYAAVQTYATNGRLLDSAEKMIDVSTKPTRYLYVKLGTIRDIFVLDSEISNVLYGKINVFLPDEYDIAVNDNFQLFYRGVVQAVNPYNYSIKISCNKGKAYTRYYEWTPTEEDVGSYKLTLIVYDNNGLEVGRDSTILNVHKPKETSENMNVLCIGDSLTAGGYWAAEAERRFTETGGAIPGLGLDYLTFVGSKKSTVAGRSVSHEGHSGWTWASFCGSDSPFWDSELNDISFKSYCERNNIDDLDIVYILLTWNGQGTSFKTDYNTESGHFVYARKLIDKLHEEYPNAVVRCMGLQMPSQNGGMGYNYGASGGYSDSYGMLITAMNYNATLEKFCKLPQYSDFVKYVDIAGQFDTDYNMPSTDKPVNNRNEITEVIGTNGVHPSVNGYYQIADAVFRSLCEIFSEEK